MNADTEHFYFVSADRTGFFDTVLRNVGTAMDRTAYTDFFNVGLLAYPVDHLGTI